MEPSKNDANDLKRKLVYAGGIVLAVYLIAIYGGHKYQMRRIRKRREKRQREEKGDA